MLTFDRTENIKKVYEITDVRGMRVEVTPYRKTTLLPQCKNCQSWGHNKSYCHNEPRCVKCAGKHTTVTSTKPKKLRQNAIIVGKTTLHTIEDAS